MGNLVHGRECDSAGLEKSGKTIFKMIEVFKTNVIDRQKADWIIGQIHDNFANYKASFDLDDCDRILVVKSTTGVVQPSLVIDLLNRFECNAEVLPDE